MSLWARCEQCCRQEATMTQSDLLIEMGLGRGTNMVCDDPEPFMLPTGCARCGHTDGEHDANRP